MGCPFIKQPVELVWMISIAVNNPGNEVNVNFVAFSSKIFEYFFNISLTSFMHHNSTMLFKCKHIFTEWSFKRPSGNFYEFCSTITVAKILFSTSYDHFKEPLYFFIIFLILCIPIPWNSLLFLCVRSLPSITSGFVFDVFSHFITIKFSFDVCMFK